MMYRIALLIPDCAIIDLRVRLITRPPCRPHHRDVARVRSVPMRAVVVIVPCARELCGAHDLGEEAHEEKTQGRHAGTDHADADLDRGPD